jgi:hypothetical protein
MMRAQWRLLVWALLLMCAGCYRIHSKSEEEPRSDTDRQSKEVKSDAVSDTGSGYGPAARETDTPIPDTGSRYADDTFFQGGETETDIPTEDTPSVEETDPETATTTETETDTRLIPLLPATGLLIEGISLFQGVEIPLMKGGAQEMSRNARVVLGRDAMMRIYLSSGDHWVKRPIEATLETESSACSLVLSDRIAVLGDSRQNDLTTTFNFDIPGECLSGNLMYRVSLFEVDGVDRGGDSGSARWPLEGEPMAALGEESTGGTLEVMLIPIAYGADGSGRLPDTSDAQLDLFREYFKRFYPIPNGGVDISVGEPLSSDWELTTDGSGWEALLEDLYNLRAERGPSPKQYYFGLVSPADSMEEYCPERCVVGYAYLQQYPGYNNGLNATAVGIGFPGVQSAQDILHLVGVLHGRGNAPACGAENENPDQDYPYEGGLIGVWGYDIVKRELKNPEDYADLMSFCRDPWISDYTYDAVFDWMQRSNNLKGGRLKPLPSSVERVRLVRFCRSPVGN